MPSGVQAPKKTNLANCQSFLKVNFVGYVKKVASSKRLTSEAIQKLS